MLYISTNEFTTSSFSLSTALVPLRFNSTLTHPHLHFTRLNWISYFEQTLPTTLFSLLSVYFQVPPGTIVRDQDGLLAGELNQPGQRLLVARGGRGGRGNEYFKTPRMTAPSLMERGEPGAERWINIELKLVADVGFVGVPNAGKSTLLAASR